MGLVMAGRPRRRMRANGMIDPGKRYRVLFAKAVRSNAERNWFMRTTNAAVCYGNEMHALIMTCHVEGRGLPCLIEEITDDSSEMRLDSLHRSDALLDSLEPWSSPWNTPRSAVIREFITRMQQSFLFLDLQGQLEAIGLSLDDFR
jgi:hypothetical protein